ncbi:Ubiquitin-specific protease 12 isoform 1 [Hibiscus syriacus]|uniref:Ubiquitin-specific protease 12 isoform 1 n=1 Tax=Hibiscus syriacus TaxID=106335 RepID=A0A6A2Z360_HIBSY|nr:Ubiquitin-specific protease 12 isoform 1 [Hibiscus syriacus]
MRFNSLPVFSLNDAFTISCHSIPYGREDNFVYVSEALMAGMAAGAVEALTSTSFELIKLRAQVPSTSRISRATPRTGNKTVVPSISRLLRGYTPDMKALNNAVGMLSILNSKHPNMVGSIQEYPWMMTGSGRPPSVHDVRRPSEIISLEGWGALYDEELSPLSPVAASLAAGFSGAVAAASSHVFDTAKTTFSMQFISMERKLLKWKTPGKRFEKLVGIHPADRNLLFRGIWLRMARSGIASFAVVGSYYFSVAYLVPGFEYPEYALVGDEKNCLLVGYFGFSHFAWCCPSQLKPFLVNFEQMIRRNKARSFLAAVEKAMDDFVKCLKSETMCSCVSRENKLLSSNSATKELPRHSAVCKSGQLAEFSAARFDPAKFLCQLKNLAQVVTKLDMLEFVVLRSYLLAFYCSVGHCRLPLHQLWETTCDAENAEKNSIPYKFLLEQSDVMKNQTLQLNQNGVSAKISGEDCGAFSSKQALTSRKRKRKIYDEVRNSNTPFEGPDQGTCVSVENGDDNSELRNESGYELRGRKKSKYFSYPYVKLEGKVSGETEDPVVLKVSHERVNEFIGSSSADILSAKKFQKTWYRKFIGGNDVTAFPELSRISSAELLSDLHFLAVDYLFSTESKTFGLVEWFFSRFRISTYHDESIYEMHCKNMASQKEATVKNPCLSGNDLLQTKPTSSPLTLPGNKRQKKKKPTISTTSNINSLSGTLDGNINFLPCNLSVKASEAMALDALNGKQTHQETKEATNIPDLNGNGAITPSSFVANENKASSGSVLLDFQAVGPHSEKTVAEQSNREGLNVVLPDSGATIPPLTIPNMVSFASESKPGQKKRRRKPKAQSGLPSPMPSSNIPDLNGTDAEPNTSIKDLQEANGVPPAEKPARKRRRKKGDIILGTTNMILSYNGAGAIGNAPATTLLLTFTLILKDSSSARVIFMRNDDAAKALRSLEESNPFSATLTKYHLQNDSTITTKRTEGFRLPANLTGLVLVPCLGDAPPNIDFMRKNLVMMTSMLEKSGDDLPPETKAKLENEIKGLLKKVSSCPGSSM